MDIVESPYNVLLKRIEEAISGACGKLGFKANSIEIRNSITPSKAFGDISSSIAFRFAKASGIDPAKVAKDIAESISSIDMISSITTENGFVNFHIDRVPFSKAVVEYALGIGKRVSGIGTGKRAMVEYPSVNPNKPWHIGHLRNALIGDSVSNILEACSFDVLRTDYIDDLGLQVAESVWWYLKGNNKPEGKFDHWLGKQYVEANKYMKEHDSVSEINKVLSLIEQDGTYESKMARDLAKECILAEYKTAFDYLIYHDLMVWESDIVRKDLLSIAMKLLEQSGFVRKEQDGDFKGCIVIDLSSIKNLPNEFKGMKENVKVLVRSNGVPTYLAKDIAFHMWKFGIIEDPFHYSVFIEKQPNGKPVYTTAEEGAKMQFNKADLAVNIIDVRQSYPQALLKLAFEAIGRTDKSSSLQHLSYGEVEIESGGLSGREGTWLGYSADDLLEEAKKKALALIKGRFDFTSEEQERIAKNVALAAIKFEFLKVGIDKKIIFSWERALNFEGNSGPYVQYMYARASRILGDAGTRVHQAFGLSGDYDFELVKSISKLQYVMEKASSEYKPNLVVEYALELADNFSRFYENAPVLKAEPGVKEARLALLAAFSSTMKFVLGTIGVDALDKM
ncbi:MAG: arginine--tRNA ligase [Candidatus Micrarchaeia archaeon]